MRPGACAPERHPAQRCPTCFEQKLELPALAESATSSCGRPTGCWRRCQVWLRARQRGVLALELQWTLDLKRFNGVDLPPHQQHRGAHRRADPRTWRTCAA